MFLPSPLLQDSFMTVVLLCGMHGIPITYLTNVLAVDWVLDRVDGLCKVGTLSTSAKLSFPLKVLTDSTAVGVICRLENNGKSKDATETC